MTYRHPVPENTEIKGVVFFIHGYGAYCDKTAFWFRMFVENGYEVFAVDQRGFGLSEG